MLSLYCGFVGVIIVSADNSRAAVVNGSFETGNLSGWTNWYDGGGYVGTTTSAVEFGFTSDTLVPTDGSFLASLYAVSGEGLQSGVLRQTFTAGVGDSLSFDFAVHSGGYLGFGGGDVLLWRTGSTLVNVSTASTSATAGWWNRMTVPITVAGEYHLQFSVDAEGSSYFAPYTAHMVVDRVVLTPFSTEAAPILPSTVVLTDPNGAPSFVFTGVPSGQWFDPPLAAGYTYEMTSDSLFTKILDFPSGFDDLFTVSVDGNVLGEFGPGQSVDFTGFEGGGVSRFQITGLTPGTDPEDPNAFPLKLLFDTNQADFTMQAILAVPEPASLALAVMGLAGCWVMRRRPRREHRPL